MLLGIGFILMLHSHFVKSENVGCGIKVTSISGTSFQTGVYYKISISRRFMSDLRAMPKSENSSAFVIMPDIGDNEDPEGERELQEQFYFASSGVEGLFNIHNRFTDKFGGIATWERQFLTRDPYYVLIFEYNKEISEDLRRNVNYMWKIEAAPEESNKFRIISKRYENTPGFLTWTEPKYKTGGHYIQIETNEGRIKKYEHGNVWWEDSVLLIEPVATTEKYPSYCQQNYNYDSGAIHPSLIFSVFAVVVPIYWSFTV